MGGNEEDTFVQWGKNGVVRHMSDQLENQNK